MTSLNDIISNPQDIFSVLEVAKALRVSRQTIDFHINRGNIKHLEIGKYRGIKGKWVKEYIVRQQGKRGDFKSIRDILVDYKLPVQQNE